MENLDQIQIIYFVSIMAITAIPVGFFAGLFGIGGGLITVPFLFFIFDILGFDKSYLMHLAVGTSFSIIIPTSIVSVLTHKKNKSVDVSIIKTYGIFVIFGVLAGIILAASLKTQSLILFFAITVYFLGTYFFLSQAKPDKTKSEFSLLPKKNIDDGGEENTEDKNQKIDRIIDDLKTL